MADNAIKARNRKKRANKHPGKNPQRNRSPVPADVIRRQEQVKTLLKQSGARAPWELSPNDLYTIRAIQLGAIL